MRPPQILGDFVHAIFPYLTYKRARGETIDLVRKAPQIERLLIRFACQDNPGKLKRFKRTYPELFSAPQLRRVLECWQYILDIVTECDEVFIEPQIGTRQPDLLVRHQGRKCIIEIKSLEMPFVSLTKSINGFRAPKLRKQTRHAAAVLREAPDDDSVVLAYALFMNISPALPFEPKWMAIHPESSALV